MEHREEYTKPFFQDLARPLPPEQVLLPEEGFETKQEQDAFYMALAIEEAKQAAKELRPLYDEFSTRYIKERDEIPPEKGLPLNLDTDLLISALNSIMKRIKIAEAEKTPKELVNPLIKRKIVSVEEKINEICSVLEEQEEASLFFLLKNSDSRAELVARFMGILELIKIKRILITSFRVIEDAVEYDENGLEMKFKLNPDFVPGDITESEFDSNKDANQSENTNEVQE